MTTSKKNANKNANKTPKNSVKGDNAMNNKKTEPKTFAELANIRVPKALKVLRSISHLANDAKYDYTDEQSTAILSALQSAVDEVSQCFANGGKKDEEAFRI